MGKKRLLLLLILFLVGADILSAQTVFSKEKGVFFDELTTYLKASSAKSGGSNIMDALSGFGEAWNTYYNDEESAIVIGLCDKIYSKSGTKAYSSISCLVEILQKLPESGLVHKEVNNWLHFTHQKAAKSWSGFDGYLSSCRSVFVEGVLSAKGNSKWLVRDAHIGFPSSEVFKLSIKGDLVLSSQVNESVISNTQGFYYIEDNRWEGSSGRSDWSRFDVPADKVYVILPNHYSLDLGRSGYTIDSVQFHDGVYFKQVALCRFEDKVLLNTPSEKTMYPRVESYRSDYGIHGLMKNIDIKGGMGMVGNQLGVFGGADGKASLVFHRNGDEVMRLSSSRFLISPDYLIVSNHAAMRIFLNDTVSGVVVTDSVYHNDLSVRYDDKSREMMIVRSEKDFGDAPFHDHYHGLDVYLEAIYWNVDENVMDFKRMEGVNPKSEGDLVSVNYFRDLDFKVLQGLDGVHPMIRLEKYMKEYANPEHPDLFYVNDIATGLGFPVEQVISLLLRLQALGYLEYDANDRLIKVLPRFYDVLESYRENIDFDIIKLHTVATNHQPNLRLDLNTKELIVYGITSTAKGEDRAAISLSDIKHVVIIPDNGRVVFKKNRDFRFSGVVLAGMFEFFTKDCLFSYEDFMINMAKIDSLRLYTRVDKKIIPINGTLEMMQGRLLIDRGDNKSSRDETPEYPKFHSDAEGYKFYRKINEGVFDPGPLDSVMTAENMKEKFYYSFYPFVVDSLNDFTLHKVKFDGELVTGGIFPNVVEPLVIMDDYSLGFCHQIGKDETDSYPMYGGLGRFHNKLYLSESGFYGEGMLDYQTASYVSDQFLFYPDSVTAVTTHFSMKPKDDGSGFPLAYADKLKLKWDVRVPELTTETMDNSICLYGDTYFAGKTALSPNGYAANGKLKFGLTEFDSDFFAFDSRTFVADSADFLLYSADSTTVAFSATNYRANVDFDTQKVKYDYLDENSNLDFPMNRYVCSLKEAEWDMPTNSLRLYNPIESFGDYATATTREELLAIHNNASKFVSLVPEQDSLQFYSMSAEYDMTNYVIHAHDVKIIRVADAAVFPYLHDVTINAESQMEPVSGEVLADTLNRFHLYQNALVEINSRTDYHAQGYWDYLDANGVKTPVFMNSIGPVNGVTCGKTNLPDSLGFQVSPQFAFRGDLTLTATKEFGEYDGQFALMGFETKLDTLGLIVEGIADTLVTDSLAMQLDSISVGQTDDVLIADTITNSYHWFASTAVINPLDVQIPVDMDRIRKETPEMCNGLYYEQAIDGSYFASFLVLDEGRAGKVEVGPVNGMLRYDADSVCYVVTDTLNYDVGLSLDSRGVIKGQGSYDLGFDLALIAFVMHGEYTQYPNDSLTICGLNAMNVPIFDDKALEAMAEVYSNVESESIDLSQTRYLHYFRSENTEEQTEERQRDMELEGYPRMEATDFYAKTIVIPDLKMVWNNQLNAFISEGKIGLGNFGKHIVNKYVDGVVVFDHRLGNITYYFQNDMFMTYINYNCGDRQLQIHATYSDINLRLYDMKEKDRTVVQDGKRFQYVAVPYESMLDFLNRLKYAGVEIGGS